MRLENFHWKIIIHCLLSIKISWDGFFCELYLSPNVFHLLHWNLHTRLLLLLVAISTRKLWFTFFFCYFNDFFMRFHFINFYSISWNFNDFYFQLKTFQNSINSFLEPNRINSMQKNLFKCSTNSSYLNMCCEHIPIIVEDLLYKNI